MNSPITTTAGGATYFGALMLVVGGWTVTDWAMIVGSVVGIGGLIVKWWYEHKRTKNDKDHNDAMLALKQKELNLQYPEELKVKKNED